MMGLSTLYISAIKMLKHSNEVESGVTGVLCFMHVREPGYALVLF